MNIHELSTYNLDDAVKFHDRLNPRLFGRDEKLLPIVRDKLLAIAADFQEFLGVDDLQLKDITLSGSNAAYSYTPHSDIDLHLVVQQPNDEIYRELFDAKKYQYNDEHNITIGGYDVELYVQDADQPHVSQGIYSVLNDDWIAVPRRRRAVIDDMSVQHKYEDIGQRVEQAIESNDLDRVTATIDKLKQIRKAGLEANGEFGPENLAYKMLRKQGYIQRLFDRKNELKDRELSLDERKKKKQKPRRKYGVFGGYWYPGTAYAGQDHAAGSEGGGDGGGGGESIREASTPDGVSPSTRMFLSETPDAKEIIAKFIEYVAQRLDIEKIPTVELHDDSAWSEGNTSFGRFDPDTHTLHVSLPNRHILDIMRTTAHELAHCRQHEIEPLPQDAGETGSEWENEAHAVAGMIMRDFTDKYPEYFKKASVDESFKSKLAAGALTAALAAGGAQAQGVTIGQALGGAVDVARTAQTLKRMGWAGAQEDLTQEIKNYSRALGGDANAQNQSWLYRTQQRQGTLPQQPQPQSAEQAAADFEAYKKEYYRKKAEFDRQFQQPQQQNEGASGYIPTKKQAKDPRFSTALTVDIKPGQVGKEANKMALKTNAQGQPALLMKTVNLRENMSLQERLEQELAKFKDNPYELIDLRNQRGPDNKFGMNGHVDEVIQTPVSKDRNAEQYYNFIVGKARLGRPLTRQEQDYVKMYQMYRQQKLAEVSDEQLYQYLDQAAQQLKFRNWTDAQQRGSEFALTAIRRLAVAKLNSASKSGSSNVLSKQQPSADKVDLDNMTRQIQTARLLGDDVSENFADGKVKGKSRPGRVKRAGASCDGSVTSLRQKAKNTGGERAKMYHWCANMKSGRQNESIETEMQTFHARVKLKNSNTLIDTQVVARNYEMAKRLLRAQYGENSVVSNVRAMK